MTTRDLFDQTFDPKRAQALKEEGIARTLAAERAAWKADVTAAVMRIRPGTEFTSQTVQRMVNREPHHPNCWGATINGIAKQGLCRGTGRYIKSERVSCHAAVIQVWIRS